MKELSQVWGAEKELRKITGRSWTHRLGGKRGGMPSGVRITVVGKRRLVNLDDFREWLEAGGDAAPTGWKPSRRPGRPRKSETLARIQQQHGVEG